MGSESFVEGPEIDPTPFIFIIGQLIGPSGHFPQTAVAAALHKFWMSSFTP